MKFRKRAVAVCFDGEKIFCVLLQDPVSRAKLWVPPGGKIEEGETPAAAAVREMREETGLQVRVRERPPLVETYPFHWAGEFYLTENHYFEVVPLAPGAAPSLVEDDRTPFVRESYILEAKWLPTEEALEHFRAHEVKEYRGEIYVAVKKLLAL